MESSHFVVAERALFFWQSEHLQTLMQPHLEEIYRLVSPALHSKHWSPHVNALLGEVLIMCTDQLQPSVVSQIDDAGTQIELKQKRNSSKIAWSLLETHHSDALSALNHLDIEDQTHTQTQERDEKQGQIMIKPDSSGPRDKYEIKSR